MVQHWLLTHTILTQDTHPKYHKEVIQGKTDMSKGKSLQHFSLHSHCHQKRKQYNTNSSPVKKLNCTVVYFIAMYNQRYSIVELSGIRALLSKFNP